MTKNLKAAAGVVLGSTLVATVMPFAQMSATAVAQAQAQTGDVSVASAAQVAGESAQVQVAQGQTSQTVRDIQGIFTYDQGVTMDNAYLAKNIYQAPQYLCASVGTSSLGGASLATDSAQQVAAVTSITVTGDVASGFSASVDDLASQYPANKVMGCTCGGNVADGRASANVQAKGILLSQMVEAAQPADDVNTITFTSADGYSVSLPLAYVEQRYCMIATNLNGEDAANAVGCSNQLWLGSTAARSFVRDVTTISITHEDVVPAAPGAVDMANQPNVGVTSGTAGATEA